MERPHRAVARHAAASLLAVTLLATASAADAVVVIFGRLPLQQLLLVVGTPSPGVVDTVTIDVPASDLGDASRPVPGSQPIDITILARAPVGPPVFTLTVDSSTPLRSAENNVIPMTEIAWTSDAGDIPSGSFAGAVGQLLLAAPPDRLVRDRLHFRYLNSTVPAAGLYRGQVRYTLSVP